MCLYVCVFIPTCSPHLYKEYFVTDNFTLLLCITLKASTEIVATVDISAYFQIFPYFRKAVGLLFASRTYFPINHGTAATTNLFY